MIGVRAGKELTVKIDKWAKANFTTRSEAIRRLIQRGLEK